MEPIEQELIVWGIIVVAFYAAVGAYELGEHVVRRWRAWRRRHGAHSVVFRGRW